MLSNRQLFYQHLAQTSLEPLAIEIEKAQGCYLYGVDGKKYLDLISGVSVSNIGHGHPTVIDAIKKQFDNHLHLTVYGEYIQSSQVQLAKLLASVLPKQLQSSYFVNSGSEAVEGALKLAKRFTNRTEIIAFHNAYHGSTHGALSVMGNETLKNKFRPLLPDIRFIFLNNLDALKNITSRTAAVIIEPIQGEAGIKIATKEFLKALSKRCEEVGALLIFDEIQTGFGRTGKLFCFEHYNITPDILVLAKAMGGGMPIGAFIASQEIMQSLAKDPALGHITTFGGHPVCCAAALANLQVLMESNLINEVQEKEKLFLKLLKHPSIKSIRSKGLLIAIEFKNSEINQKIIHKCISNGVIVDWFLFNSQSMRIAPPLIITEKEIKTACKAILDAIKSI